MMLMYVYIGMHIHAYISYKYIFAIIPEHIAFQLKTGVLLQGLFSKLSSVWRR